ncbi:MAG: serpin family protein [Candidatus Eremiobacteraeota bacterium]|nr:serpin family protein [Candidatus Eremiobacteraeota bacterium]
MNAGTALKRTLLTIVVIIIGTSACAGSASTPISARYNAFGFDLFGKLTGSDQGNVVVSPISVALALSMAQNGAAAKTRTAIARVLHVSDLSDAQLNAGAAQLMQNLPTPSNDLQFSIANSLWVKNGFPIREAFSKEIQSSYRAKVANISFDSGGIAQLNGWVKENTLGLVPKILDRFETLDAAVLANAVALKAKWLHPFNHNQTSAGPFYPASGASHSVSMMRQTADFEYAKGSDWQLVRLPYRGDRFSMYVFLPAKGSRIAITGSLFDQARSRLKSTSLALELPRFVVNYKTELNGPLSALGMGIAFDPNGAANFSRLTPKPVYITKVAHVTYVRVDEDGTQAGAATAIVITETVARRGETMIVDHPFYMILRDDQTGQALFLGHITAPT